MPTITTQTQLQQLRLGDRVKYHGVQWDVKDYSTYNDPQGVDVSRLLSILLERAQELPPHITRDLKQLFEKISSGQPLSNLPTKTSKFIMLLSFTLLMANLVTPDAVFAKGFSGGSGYGYSSDGNYSSGEGDLKFLGFLLTVGGVWWLGNLLSKSDDE